jgi:acetone carboxylase gamma subunit
MGKKVQITEYLDIDLDGEMWCCHQCGMELISAKDSYKKGCLVYERDPRTIYDPVIKESPWSFSPPADWVAIVEFYCPGCGIMIENELLPLGHPITHDIELDMDKLKQKHLAANQEGGQK